MPRTEHPSSPISVFLESSPALILDGGLATELEARGCDLSSDLWSAGLLLDRSDLIREVHLDYLRAGADCVVSASYQATLEGFIRVGLTRESAIEVLESSVDLARSARNDFWSETANRRGRLEPLVAASIGPYGAYLADGSEFCGDYGLDEDQLLEFHRHRWEVLASAGADLLACETLPSLVEARALRRLLETTSGAHAWFSFSCRDGRHLNDGAPIEKAAAELEDCAQVVAIGVNCTHPRFISSLLDRLRTVTSRPLIVYPNSGENWDAQDRRWKTAPPGEASLLSSCRSWVRKGARLVGGCCRTGPREIEQIRRRVLRSAVDR